MNAQTGPRTKNGKARSSQNSLKSGLFSNRDYILPGEQAIYDETLESLLARLRPDGVLEITLTAEIMTATWRLRRCGLLEHDLSNNPEMTDEELDKQQRSIDRARSQAHRILHRCTGELRKLQNEAAVRNELNARGFNADEFPGLTDSRLILSVVRTLDTNRAPKKQPQAPAVPHDLESLLAMADLNLGMKSSAGISFCNSPASPSQRA